MKKFPITKFYFNLFVASFVIFLFLTIFYTKILSEDGLTFNDCIIIVVHAFGAIWMLKALIFTFSSGKVSVDRSGCIMYIGWKKYCYAWDDLPCCGMADVDVGSVGNAVDTYWVYLSGGGSSEIRTAMLKPWCSFSMTRSSLISCCNMHRNLSARSSSSFPVRRNGSARPSPCASADSSFPAYKNRRRSSSRSGAGF